jgi:hypothetical protein
VLLEAALAAGFFALSVPFGYLSRRVKNGALVPAKKWSLFLGVVHAPVLPLIVIAKLGIVGGEFELLLAGLILAGHATGVLAHRRYSVKPAPTAAAANL